MSTQWEYGPNSLYAVWFLTELGALTKDQWARVFKIGLDHMLGGTSNLLGDWEGTVAEVQGLAKAHRDVETLRAVDDVRALVRSSHSARTGQGLGIFGLSPGARKKVLDSRVSLAEKAIIALVMSDLITMRAFTVLYLPFMKDITPIDVLVSGEPVALRVPSSQ